MDILGPETDYLNIPVSISGTAFRLWKSTDGNIDHEIIVEQLIRGVVDIYGTSSAPPSKGFSFDSYNSGLSIRETTNKMRNFGIEPFAKETSYATTLRAIMGDKLFSELDQLDSLFVGRTPNGCCHSSGCRGDHCCHSTMNRPRSVRR